MTYYSTNNRVDVGMGMGILFFLWEFCGNGSRNSLPTVTLTIRHNEVCLVDRLFCI